MRSLIVTLGLMVALALVLGASALAAPPLAPAATCIWNGTTGNWSDSTRWSCLAVPGENDTATIGNGTVDITGSVTVQNLILSGEPCRAAQI